MNDYLPQNNSVDTELTENSRLGDLSYKRYLAKWLVMKLLKMQVRAIKFKTNNVEFNEVEEQGMFHSD